MSIARECKEYCLRNDLLSCKEILVGVSGGADSMCLLDLLCKMKDLCDEPQCFPAISVAHVHHGLRESAGYDENLVKAYCEKRDIPLYVCHADVSREAATRKIGIEEAGRLVRYNFFYETASRMKASREDVFIAVAHHMDDQAETILLNLFRGAGTDGLCGIYPRNGNLIRPLLFATKVDILRYVEDNSIPFVSDQTNSENDYMRNRIRNQVLPVISKAIGKDPVPMLARTSDLMKADKDFFAGEIAKLMQERLSYTEEGIPFLSVKSFVFEPKAIATRMIRALFVQRFGECKDISASQVDEILSLAKRRPHCGRICLPHHRFAGFEEGVLFYADASEKENWCRRWVPIQEEYLLCQEMEECDTALLDRSVGSKTSILFSKNDYNVRILFVENPDQLVYNNRTWYCTEELLLGAHMRTRRSGDLFAQAGSSGHKLLRRYLTDRKISGSVRDRLLIVAKGSEVLWIPGVGHAIGFVNEVSAKRFFTEANAEDSEAYFASGRKLLRVEWFQV